jgi:phosphate transport system permease protein
MEKKYIKENIVKAILFIFAFISVITTAAIVISLFTESIPFFNVERIKQLFSYGELWDPRGGKYYVLPLVVGTMMIVVFSCLFAIPLGLGSAIYLSEYASPKTRNILKPVLEILAGIPSVVYGFFALFYITPFLKKNISWIAKFALIFLVFFSLYMIIKCVKAFIDKDGIKARIFIGTVFLIFLVLFIYLIINFIGFFAETSNLKVDTFNVLSSSFAVGIMITPLVASISEDALKAVPKTMREGSLGLGATKFETVWNVTIPAAISGIVSSFILAISRAVGETMVVAMAAGAKPVLNFNPLGQIQTMTGYMVNKSFGEVMVGSLEFQTIFVVGLLLFFMTFLLNVIAKTIVLKFREEY